MDLNKKNTPQKTNWGTIILFGIGTLVFLGLIYFFIKFQFTLLSEAGKGNVGAEILLGSEGVSNIVSAFKK